MVLLQTSTSQKNILLILRDRTDQTVVENWRPSRKKNDSIRDVSCLNRCTEFHTSQGGMGLRKMTNSSIV